MAVAMISATAVITSAEEEPYYSGEDVVTGYDVESTDATTGGEIEDVTIPDETVETEPVTEPATEVPSETSATIAPTTAPTTAPTAAPTVAPTAKSANTPKTGDNVLLYVGIGVIVVALIAIIATVIAKKKKNRNQ